MASFCVLDCSVAISWMFKDERTDYAMAILDRLDTESGLVPVLFYYEVANVLATSQRRGRVTQRQVDGMLDHLSTLSLDAVWGLRVHLPGILELSRKHKLTAYDATYLELATRTGLPLATLDARLRAAAEAEGTAAV